MYIVHIIRIAFAWSQILENLSRKVIKARHVAELLIFNSNRKKSHYRGIAGLPKGRPSFPMGDLIFIKRGPRFCKTAILLIKKVNTLLLEWVILFQKWGTLFQKWGTQFPKSGDLVWRRPICGEMVPPLGKQGTQFGKQGSFFMSRIALGKSVPPFGKQGPPIGRPLMPLFSILTDWGRKWQFCQHGKPYNMPKSLYPPLSKFPKFNFHVPLSILSLMYIM